MTVKPAQRRPLAVHRRVPQRHMRQHAARSPRQRQRRVQQQTSSTCWTSSGRDSRLHLLYQLYQLPGDQQRPSSRLRGTYWTCRARVCCPS
jgi:hypothetical protein